MESERGERSLGEERIKGLTKGDNKRNEDNGQRVGNDCSEAQRSDRGVCEFSSSSTSSLSSYIPPTPRYTNMSSKIASKIVEPTYIWLLFRRLNLQLNLSTSLLKRNSNNNQVVVI